MVCVHTHTRVCVLCMCVCVHEYVSQYVHMTIDKSVDRTQFYHRCVTSQLYAVLVCGPSDHGAISVLCLACGGEAVARDQRVLHSATASNIVAASSNIDCC